MSLELLSLPPSLWPFPSLFLSPLIRPEPGISRRVEMNLLLIDLSPTLSLSLSPSPIPLSLSPLIRSEPRVSRRVEMNLFLVDLVQLQREPGEVVVDLVVLRQGSCKYSSLTLTKVKRKVPKLQVPPA